MNNNISPDRSALVVAMVACGLQGLYPAFSQQVAESSSDTSQRYAAKGIWQPVASMRTVRNLLSSEPFEVISLDTLPADVRQLYAATMSLRAIHRVFATGNEEWNNTCIKSPSRPSMYLVAALHSPKAIVVCYRTASAVGITSHADVFVVADGVWKLASNLCLHDGPTNVAEISQVFRRQQYTETGAADYHCSYSKCLCHLPIPPQPKAVRAKLDALKGPPIYFGKPAR